MKNNEALLEEFYNEEFRPWAPQLPPWEQLTPAMKKSLKGLTMFYTWKLYRSWRELKIAVLETFRG